MIAERRDRSKNRIALPGARRIEEVYTAESVERLDGDGYFDLEERREKLSVTARAGTLLLFPRKNVRRVYTPVLR